MKKLLVLIVFLSAALISYAQIQSPVSWTFSAKKIDAKTYEVHMIATVGSGWHIYSQTTPDGGPVATTIKFTKNPLLTLDGAAKELGKLEQRYEPLFDVDVKQFSNKVEFVQIIKMKAPVKTNVAGSIEFMVCNDTECLPPSEKKFSIALK